MSSTDALNSLNIELTYNPRLNVYPKELKTGVQTKLVQKRSQQDYSQSPKGGNHPNAYQLMNGSAKLGLYVRWDLFSHQEE